MAGIRKQLIEMRASVEASIDFGDDVGFQWKDIRVAIDSMISELSSIQEQMHQGTLINEGLRIVILGQANVGKSSLFNHLGDHFRIYQVRNVFFFICKIKYLQQTEIWL